MKLKDLIIDFLEDKDSKKDSKKLLGVENYLKPEDLKQLKSKLLQCDEFKDVSELVILESPVVQNDKNEIIEAISVKLDNNIKFKKRFYLYSVSLTPEVYDPKTMYEPVKNGATITQTLVSKTLAPEKKIVLTFNPENLQDKKTETTKQLHSTLDEILSNSKEYQRKGERHVIVRGIFETIEKDGKKMNTRKLAL